jgi:hypothetical protein
MEGSTLATFIHLKDLIDLSQKLFYFDIEEGDQIYLKTDASDYGIDARTYTFCGREWRYPSASYIVL